MMMLRPVLHSTFEEAPNSTSKIASLSYPTNCKFLKIYLEDKTLPSATG